jgi:hypothetical protein
VLIAMATLMNETYREMSGFRKGPLAISSTLAGAVLVAGAFRLFSLNWIVDVPGWFVSRIVPIDFHEGEGAFGFF